MVLKVFLPGDVIKIGVSLKVCGSVSSLHWSTVTSREEDPEFSLFDRDSVE
jgi:hypothetical protein